MDDAKPDASVQEVVEEFDLFDPNEPDIFDEWDEEAERAAIARALADVKAGRVVSHEAVKKWLQSWGTDNPLPRPKCGD